jgi:hypothetical protein
LGEIEDDVDGIAHVAVWIALACMMRHCPDPAERDRATELWHEQRHLRRARLRGYGQVQGSVN